MNRRTCYVGMRTRVKIPGPVGMALGAYNPSMGLEERKWIQELTVWKACLCEMAFFWFRERPRLKGIRWRMRRRHSASFSGIQV